MADVRGVFHDPGVLARDSHSYRLLALAAPVAVFDHCAGLDGDVGRSGAHHISVARSCAVSRVVAVGAGVRTHRAWILAVPEVRGAVRQAAVVWLVGVESGRRGAEAGDVGDSGASAA